MKIISRLFVLIVLTLPSLAHAATQTLGFDALSCSNPDLTSPVTEGSATYTNTNTFFYGQCSDGSLFLGDNDFLNIATIQAVNGSPFDIISAMIVSARVEVYRIPRHLNLFGSYNLDAYEATVPENLIPDFKLFRAEGYRDGHRVATLEVNPVVGVLWFDDRFRNIDRVVLSTVLYGPNDEGWSVALDPTTNRSTLACSNGCGSVGIDNVVLSNIAPVPLPPAAPLMASGLMLLALLRWRRRG